MPASAGSRSQLLSLNRWSWTGALAAVSLALVSCGHEHDPAAATMCSSEKRADAYQPGLQKAGMQSRLSFRLVESQPGPPVKGDNVWTVQLLDAMGMPMSGGQLTASPFMPDHGHGTPVKVVVEDQGGGSYKLAPVNLFMAGLWVVTIAATVPGQGPGPNTTDQTTFSFCVEG